MPPFKLFQTCLSKHEDDVAIEKSRREQEQKKKAEQDTQEREADAAVPPRKKSEPSARQPKSHDPAELPIIAGGDREATDTDDESIEAESGGGGGVAAIVIILMIVAVVGVGAFLVLRTRLAPRLRARLTNTPYGDIIGSTDRSESTQNVIA